MNKVWNGHEIEYLVIERNKVSIEIYYDMANLQNFMLTERSQSEKAIHCMEIYGK